MRGAFPPALLRVIMPWRLMELAGIVQQQPGLAEQRAMAVSHVAGRVFTLAGDCTAASVRLSSTLYSHPASRVSAGGWLGLYS
eukprot:SAG25_NODE_1478_length_2942_cov_11.625747_5_plen_83_part_00